MQQEFPDSNFEEMSDFFKNIGRVDQACEMKFFSTYDVLRVFHSDRAAAEFYEDIVPFEEVKDVYD